MTHWRFKDLVERVKEAFSEHESKCLDNEPERDIVAHVAVHAVLADMGIKVDDDSDTV